MNMVQANNPSEEWYTQLKRHYDALTLPRRLDATLDKTGLDKLRGILKDKDRFKHKQ